MREQVGICGNCGGKVMAHTGAFFGKPPTPECATCGAVVDQNPRMPVLPMTHKKEPETWSGFKWVREQLKTSGEFN